MSAHLMSNDENTQQFDVITGLSESEAQEQQAEMEAILAEIEKGEAQSEGRYEEPSSDDDEVTEEELQQDADESGDDGLEDVAAEDGAQVQDASTEDGPVASKWEQIRQQERKLREERQQLLAQQHQMRLEQQAQQEQQQRQQQSSVDFQEALRTDPFGTLEKAGISFDGLARRYLNGDTTATTPQATVGQPAQPSSELAELRKEIAELKSLTQAQKEAEAKNAFQADVGQTLQSDNFAILAGHPQAVQEVTDYCALYYKQFGQVPSLTDAATAVQNTYVELLKKQTSHQAVREALGLTEQPQSKLPKKPAATKSKGLSPSMSSGPGPKKPNPELDPNDDSDDFAAALAMVPDFNWDEID